jgi:hypothetical protein
MYNLQYDVMYYAPGHLLRRGGRARILPAKILKSQCPSIFTT